MAKHEFDDGVQINITPLIDILFILLLFFILTSTFDITDEKAIDVTLPEADTEQAVESPDLFTITVDRDDNILYQNAVITPEQLNEIAAGRDIAAGDMITVIAADEKASHGRVMTVLDTLRANSITDINIQVK